MDRDLFVKLVPVGLSRINQRIQGVLITTQKKRRIISRSRKRRLSRLSTVGLSMQPEGNPEEDLDQTFKEIFLDRTFLMEEDRNTHMEINHGTPEDVLPPLEDFDEPAPAEEYYDSDDDCELDWTDIIPEDNNADQQSRNEAKNEEKEDTKKEQTHLGIPSKTSL